MFRIDENIKGEDNYIIKEDLKKYDMIVISDYNKGFIGENLLKQINNHPLIFADTKKKDLRMFKDAIIKINEKEDMVIKNKHSGELIVTLGKRGCSYDNDIYPTRVVNVIDVTGAGDSFLSGLTTHYIKTQDIREAIKYANIVSSIAVSKRGTATVTKEEVEAIYNGKNC